MNFKINKRKFFLFIIIIFTVSYPHGSSYYFNGAPFTNVFELIFILIILPFFLILGWEEIFKKKFYIIYIFLLIIKLILIISPTNGINIYQFENIDNLKINNFIRTYDSFWNNKSYVQKKNWKEKNDFPIDWKEYGGNKIGEIQYKHKLRSQEDFEKISLAYKVNFFILPNKSKSFILKSNGCDFSDFELVTVDQKNYSKKFKCNEEIFLENKLYFVEGSVKFSGNNWSFEPLIKKNNEIYKSAFKNNNIFTENNFFLKDNYTLFIQFISNLFVFLIILFPVILFISLLNKDLIIRKYFVYSFLFFLLYLFIDYFIYGHLRIQNFDNNGSGRLSIALIVFFLIYFFYEKKLKLVNIKNLNLLYLIVFSPTILFYFFKLNSYVIGKVSSFGWNDDWHIFEFFARSIVVNGEWLLAGEEIIYFRLAPRYVYAISHILFGKSLFFIKFFEPVLILFSAYVVSLLTFKIIKSSKLSILSGVTLLIFFFGENYRWLIGKGLAEFYALFLIFFFIYICFHIQFSLKQIFLLSIISTLGISFREEHVFLYLSLIFTNFLYEKNAFYRNKNFFVILYYFFLDHYKKILFYWFLVIFGFSLLFIRNYYLSGDFAIFDHTNLLNKKLNYLVNFSRILLGNNPETSFLPKSTSIFLLSSLIISFFCLLKKNIKYLNNQIFLPIFIFSILFPYFFVTNWAYPPRFSIHYLPFCIIIFYIFFSKFILKIRK